MEWINYHHLLYFWVAAREGSITRASERLNLAQPTVSGQIQSLEKSIGERLFLRQGRKLSLTETGRMVFGYADQIFTIGQELVDALRDRPNASQRRIKIGVVDSLPKLVACSLLQDALAGDDPIHLTCREGRAEDLLTELATYGLDLVIADAPIPPTVKVKAFNHLLGKSPMSIYGTKDLVRRFGPDFPASLDGAPMMLPTENTVVRQQLDAFFERQAIRPRVIADVEGCAMMTSFGQRGAGLFPAPSFLEAEICEQHGVVPAGVLEDIHEPIYAITIERRIKNPSVLEITGQIRARLGEVDSSARAG